MEPTGIASGINSLVRTAGGSVAGAATASILTGSLVKGTAIPALHGYVVCFVIVAVGAWLAAAVAIFHGVRHRAS
jgi:hypothetical protein